MQNNAIASAQAVQETVRASINERKFFESMKHLFATSFSVIGELMQNARRAGATRIEFEVDIEHKTASITDNGCGIDDFQLVIALCDSGWDEQVTLTDKPFGMGLFSLFFAAERVVFRSNGRRLDVGLDDIVNKRSLIIRQDTEPAQISGTRVELISGTRVELIGLKENLLRQGNNYGQGAGLHANDFAIINEIRYRAQGFPVPVLINGEECAQPHARGNLYGVVTPIGFVSYTGVTSDHAVIPTLREYQLYLQGLPIGNRKGLHAPIVVHLDSSTFTARMPDRSELYDSADQLAKVETELKALVRRHLTRLKCQMMGHDFVQDHWENCKRHHLMDLMDDIPWVPEKCLYSVNQVAAESDEVWTSHLSDTMVPRSAFLDGKVKAWFDAPNSTDEYEHAALVLKVMQEQKIFSPQQVSGEHWLRKLAPSVNDLKFIWSPREVSGEAMYWGDLGQCTIHLCKGVDVEVLSSTDLEYRLSTTFTDGWLVVPAGKTSVDFEDEDASAGETELVCYEIGQGNAPDHPVDAMGTFRDEHEVYREEWRDEASKAWTQKVRAMKGVSLSQMVQTVLQAELTNLDIKQARQLALVRATQRRRGDGELTNPQPDVIDLMDQQFWIKVAKTMDQGATADPRALAERMQQAFTQVVQPGFQEPSVDHQQ